MMSNLESSVYEGALAVLPTVELSLLVNFVVRMGEVAGTVIIGIYFTLVVAILGMSLLLLAGFDDVAGAA